ncbi:uncharacterized protein An11g00880 [Aspergillus niger]|uniref:Contig An11c0040, genomic contig n=2 Tax=Aspergillus niger TaxID=5061 RepID=A2QVC2_ASPNC|nr:uncharacterized protein An11g00880 [Aspergillus niger]CAK96879.1 unnamed protein product [Aspergillus niger]
MESVTARSTAIGWRGDPVPTQTAIVHFRLRDEVFQERHDLGGTHGGINHESRSLSGTKEPWGRRQQDIMELELGS